MKGKHLAVLAAAAAALLVLFLALKARQEPGGGLPPSYDLLQKPLQLSEVETIVIRAGDDEIRLVSRDEGWFVEHGAVDSAVPPAPADQNWVNQLLESMEGLDAGGDVRATSPEVHADFELTDDQAIQVQLLQADGSVRHDFMVGKQTQDYKGTFLRREGTDEVVLVRTPIRQRLRVRGTPEEPKLEAEAWWALRMYDVVPDEIASIEVAGEAAKPHTVVRDEPEPAEPEGDEAAAAGGPPEEPGLGMPAPLAWKVTGGTELDDPAFFVRSVANVRAVKVAPADAPTGLGEGETPTATVSIHTTDGRTLGLEFGAEAEEPEGARYVRRTGEEVVYIFPSYTVKNVLEPREPQPEETEDGDE